MEDLEFAERFARHAGGRIVALRKTAGRRKKLDRTDVTDADESLNDEFIQAVERREGSNASVKGEERSKMTGAARVWVIDPVDGTGEYVDDSVPDRQLTTCVGISLLVQGRLTLSVVNNPFRREMFTAQAGGSAKLNGRAITCSSADWRRGMRYDYAHWDSAPYDLRGLERVLGRPIGHYSAIYQACMVATGRSAFAAFPGNTIHDIAPGGLVVFRAAGRVTDLRGGRLDWDDLGRGVLYANRVVHAQALRAIAAL